jgi:hypothetical protein
MSDNDDDTDQPYSDIDSISIHSEGSNTTKNAFNPYLGLSPDDRKEIVFPPLSTKDAELSIKKRILKYGLLKTLILSAILLGLMIFCLYNLAITDDNDYCESEPYLLTIIFIVGIFIPSPLYNQ